MPHRSAVIHSASFWRIALPCAVMVGGLWFALTWRVGFDLSDEGFYWYGAQRTLMGELPLRDFMSYDIGRYFIAASVMWLMGDDGIFAARVAGGLVRIAGTALALWLCILSLRDDTGEVARWVFALIVAALITLWIWPYYKSFDHGASAAVVCAGLMLLRSRSRGAWLVVGIIVGAVAVMGRHHGVYAAVTCLLLTLTTLRDPAGRQAAWGRLAALCAGVALGFLPNVGLALFAEGYAEAFWQSIIWIFESGTTNLGRPVPWPWIDPQAGSGHLLRVSNALLGSGFVGVLAFPVLAAFWLARQPWPLQGTRQQVVAAATAASVPYAHYAFARPDATHLALGIVPALVGTLALVAGLRAWRLLLAAAVVLMVSVLALGQSQQILHARFFGGVLVAEQVQGQTLRMYRRPAQRLRLARRVFGTDVAPRFLAVPDLMGLYAIYRMRSPTWEIYPLFKRPPSFEAAEVARLQARPPEWIVLSDHALDGIDDRRFSRWRPTTHAWIMAHYRPLDLDPKPDRDLAVLARERP